MMRLLTLLLVLLLPIQAHANPMLMWMATGDGAQSESFTVNGYSSVTTDNAESGGVIALLDTGTEANIATGDGNISVSANCSVFSGVSGVYLYVDGAVRSSLECSGSQSKSETIYWAVSAGSHSVRVTSNADLGDYASASNFRKPTP